ncbi:MAG TPA: PAS domain-containing protein, partial [Candidatus Limnocylindrales bacterium]|nr:PAS domain-containing protein [Candidatus Limnocylindrales bacterium]
MSVRSVLRVGRARAKRAEWILEAIQQLKEEEDVERVGAWLEEPVNSSGPQAGPVVLRGEVWERGEGNAPPEWSRLGGDAPLPMELLDAGMSCEYEVEGPVQGVILGPLVDLQRVLWVPVLSRRTLRGLLMLGSRKKQKQLPRAVAERVADDLGLLLEFEDERRLSEMRKADLELHRRVESMAADGQNANLILGQLAESCTRGNSWGGVGAVFAMIGEQKSGLPVSAPSLAAGEQQLLIRAHSGENAWIYAVNQGPLDNLWRQAIGTRRVVGMEANQFPLGKEVSRIVAVPLHHRNVISGVLLAGLPRRRASLEHLERLELRALLAAEILEQERQIEAGLRQQLWFKALLECSEEPVVMVDRHGFLAGMSQGARKLARTEATEFARGISTQRFAELFRPRMWEQVQEWVRGAFQPELRGKQDALESELSSGASVLLSASVPSGKEFLAVRLQSVGDSARVRRIEDLEKELQETLEWLEEGVALFGDKGEILARNGKFLQILGFTEEQGRHLHTLEDIIQVAAKNAADPDSFAADWRSLANDASEGSQEELTLEKPVPQVIERSARPIFSREGKKLGHVEVYREATTRRLFQSRMVQAEKLAALGQRVLGIMHELSNPLTTILGSAQRMVLRSASAEPPEEVHRILEEAERAT